MGTKTLLPRARLLTALSLSMAVTMAWPSGVPFVVMASQRMVVETPAISTGSRGPSIGSDDRPGAFDSGGWRAQADDLEEPDDRDLSRFLMLAVLPAARDIPSLVPSSIEPVFAAPPPVYAPFPRSRLLRC